MSSTDSNILEYFTHTHTYQFILLLYIQVEWCVIDNIHTYFLKLLFLVFEIIIALFPPCLSSFKILPRACPYSLSSQETSFLFNCCYMHMCADIYFWYIIPKYIMQSVFVMLSVCLYFQSSPFLVLDNQLVCVLVHRLISMKGILDKYLIVWYLMNFSDLLALVLPFLLLLCLSPSSLPDRTTPPFFFLYRSGLPCYSL